MRARFNDAEMEALAKLVDREISRYERMSDREMSMGNPSNWEMQDAYLRLRKKLPSGEARKPTYSVGIELRNPFKKKNWKFGVEIKGEKVRV